MNLKKYLAAMAGVSMLAFTSCTSETYELAVPEFSPADITEGVAYLVNVDQATNTVTMQSLLPEKYLLSWIHPNGQSREANFSIQLPFSGEYEVKFGVQTKGGLVYGEPYSFTIENTNGDLLTDKVWIDLTGGADNSKTWTWDVNNLSGFTCLTFADGYDWNYYMNGIDPGSDNGEWAWAAGFQDWLYGRTDGSPLTAADFPDITFDLINGSHVKNESTGVSGAFNYNPSTHQMSIPANINIIGEFCPDGFVESTTTFEVVAINEHVFGFKLRRLADPCDLVFIYVEKGWDGSWSSEGAPAVTEPEIPFDGNMDDLTTSTSNTKTWKLNDVSPYDWYWWDGIKSEWVNNGLELGSNYGASWCPSPDEDMVAAFSLQLTKGSSSNSYNLTNDEGTFVGTYTIDGTALVFDNPLPFLIVPGNKVSVDITTNKLYVVKYNSDDNEVVLGVPTKVNSNGVFTEYLCINLVQSVESGQPSGPTLFTFDNNGLLVYNNTERNGQLEVELYKPSGWGGSATFFNDVESLSFKKNQTLSVTFSLSGITWKDGTQPRAYVGCNDFGHSWDAADRFEQDYAVPVNLNGETTVSIVNNTGGTYKFLDKDCIIIVVETTPETVASPVGEDGYIDVTDVKMTVSKVSVE